MSSHIGSIFLNSCIKVPIDPCNNCPAPVYNRQKIFLSGNMTPTSTKLLVSNKITDIDLEMDTLYHTNGMRSLATFYNSIPDYCEINHLPENEFYSTLERLKKAYCNLKSSSIFVRKESHISLNYETTKPFNRKFVPSRNTTKKISSRKSSAKKDDNNAPFNQSKFSYKDFYDKMKIFDYKPSDKEQLKNATTPEKGKLNSLYKSLSMHHLKEEDQIEVHNFEKLPQTEMIPSKWNFSTTKENREHMKKSYSFNDLYTKCWKDGQSPEANTVFCRYPEGSTELVPKIIMPSSPENLGENKVESSKESHFKNTQSSGKSKSKKQGTGSTKVPFSFLEINESSVNGKIPSVFPIHPVARPNLAAMLRLEVSKKKVKELRNNCTFIDKRPQVDWEVRKTPAWKSLGHNESHKDILAFRLATRKAEQEHQRRQYEMHMEIMRQRVKSAPLLLEGSTFWGPYVGKVSHSCYKDDLKNTCKNGTKGQKKKKVNRSSYKKYNSNISYSRISNHSTNLQESDELSSIDRAYL